MRRRNVPSRLNERSGMSNGTMDGMSGMMAGMSVMGVFGAIVAVALVLVAAAAIKYLFFDRRK